MKYDHSVKYNGVLYPSGADVPVKETKKTKKNLQNNETPPDLKNEDSSKTNDGEENQGE